MTTTPPQKSRRRFLQFSLRTLLVFVLLVSIGMSWFAVRMQKARKQQEAVEAIEKAGGQILFDWKVDHSSPQIPKWPRAIFGDDFFFIATGVQIYGISVTTKRVT